MASLPAPERVICVAMAGLPTLTHADEGKHQGGTSQAIFALAQAIVGVLGTVLTALVGARHEVPRIWREALRSLAVNLPTRVQAADRLRR